MENREDILIKTSLKRAGLESPQPDFLRSVMSKIEVKEEAPSIIYQADDVLISKKGWLLICTIVVTLLSCIFFMNSDEKPLIAIQWEMPVFALYFKEFVSRLFVIGVVCVAFLSCFYIWIMSHFWEKVS